MDSTFNVPNFLSSDSFAYWDTLSKASLESSKQLESLNMKLAEKLMKKQAELFNTAVTAGNQVIAMFSEGKALPEILADQGKLTTELGNKWLAVTRETGEILAASQEEYRTWFEQGFKRMTEQAQAAASTFVPAGVRKAA